MSGPVFLSWQQLLALCIRHGSPVLGLPVYTAFGCCPGLIRTQADQFPPCEWDYDASVVRRHLM